MSSAPNSTPRYSGSRYAGAIIALGRSERLTTRAADDARFGRVPVAPSDSHFSLVSTGRSGKSRIQGYQCGL
jgi:hypothetical protein